jgi:(2Fe-2S) ferredoxin
MTQYEKHVFVCTSGKDCKAADSAATFDFLKRAARDAEIGQRVRVNHSGCMAQCGHGPMVVVYPENVWYGGVTVERAQQIFDDHLVGGVPVDDLRYIAPPGDNKIETDTK